MREARDVDLAGGMTAPCEVLPNRFHLLTRRCTQRLFLLRPDEATNNAFLYCLIEAALYCEINLLLACAMSNHYHTVVFDPHGRLPEFLQRFHSLLAKCINTHRGRWENVWSSEAPSKVRLEELEDLLDKLTYTATNPVKDGLVEEVHHWPGVNTLAALLNGKTLRATKPDFFRDNGNMPDEVELVLTLPPEAGDPDELKRLLRERVAAVEAEQAAIRARTGRRVLGRRRVLRQSWRDCPTSHEPRRGLRPRIACKNKWARIEALQRNKQFVAEYRLARRAWLAGTPIPFPPGTYWLRRFVGVPVAPLPN
jgi:REP element-mobilizing transposase RayT